MKLFYSSASPYARKCWIVALEAGFGERLVTVPTTVTPHQPDRAFAQKNPLVKIPVLERDDGSVLYDSAVICEYLDAEARAGLFPPAGEARWQALRRHALADGIMDACLLARYETLYRPEALRWTAWVEGQYAKIDNGLDAFEHEVDGLGEAFLIDQIALACALGYLDFRFAARDWRPGRPRLARWFAQRSQRESVRRTFPTA